MTDETKIGARHSRSDSETLQTLHDYAVKLGAMCETPPAPKSADVLVWQGGAVKALGNGRVGGYLVRFSTASDPDLAGDFFTAETDFGDVKQTPVLYHHGLDATLKKRRIGNGTLKIDDTGAWIEAQLELRDEYEKAVYELVEAGKMGWSSGTAPHLVEREAKGGAHFVKSWPLGLDASITPTPAEYRNTVISLKSLLAAQQPVEASPDGGKADVSQTPIEATGVTEMTKHNVKSGMLELEAEAEEVTEAPAEEEIATAPKSYATKAAGIVSPPRRAPAQLRQPLNDTFPGAFKAWMTDGDTRGVNDLMGGPRGDTVTIKASNATDMNITTAADGGALVPTGFYETIIQKRSEAMLAKRLGVMPIPGVGTTVDVPIDNSGNNGEFVSTSEASQFDEDTPAVSKVSLTLVKYTKRMLVSDELLTDTPTNLMDFLSTFVARGMAQTHNDLLVTAAEATTSLKTFASASTIAAGEIDQMPFNATLGEYLDDSSSVAWVMNRSTGGLIYSLGSTSIPYYRGNPDGNRNSLSGAASLLGYPVYYTSKADAYAASKKSVFFGNWSYMGYREAPSISFIRDIYTRSDFGQVRLLYYFRTVYGALQPTALGYGLHPSA